MQQVKDATPQKVKQKKLSSGSNHSGNILLEKE